MKQEKRAGDYTQIIVIGLLSLLFYLLQFTALLPLRIGNANPVPLLPLLAAVSIFYGEWYGMTLGLILGMAADAASAQAVCFHTLLFLGIGLGCGALSAYVLNKNLRAALLLSFGASFLYFGLKWVWYLARLHDPGAVSYLFHHTLPGAVYTALWILPFYAFFRRLTRRRRTDPMQ